VFVGMPRVPDDGDNDMSDSEFNEAVARPTMCPFCKGKVVDTLAKVITVKTFWRCRECDRTWTIATASSARPR
jgi:transposase-like protein